MLLAARHHELAATAGALARVLSARFQLRELLVDELLEKVRAQLDADTYARAVAAAEGLKPSEAIQQAREALGL